MPETHRKFHRDFQQGAVWLCWRPGSRSPGLPANSGSTVDGTLGNWIARQRRARAGAGRPLSHDERAELDSLRKENAELRMHLQDAGSVNPTPDPPSTTPAHSHPSEGEAGVMPRLAGSGRINRGPEPCRGRS